MSNIDWNDEHKESQEEVREALEQVRTRGEKLKTKRRAAVGGLTGTAALVTVLSIVALNGGGSTNPANQAAPPSTSPSTTPTSQIQVSLVSKVIQTAQGALSSVRSISATEHDVTHAVNLKDYTGMESDSTIAYRIAPDGSYWSSTTYTAGVNAHTKEDVNYSATNGKVVDCSGPNGSSQDWICTRRYGPRPIQTRLAQFNSVITQASETPNATADETTTDSKPTWTLQFDTHPNMSDAKMHVSLIVDQQTGLPVRLSTAINAAPYEEATLGNLVVNPTLTPSQLTVTPPTGVTVQDMTDANTVFGPHVSPALASKVPVSRIGGFTTNEFWSTVHAGELYSGACLPANFHGVDNGHIGDVSYVDQMSRAGLLYYSVRAIDLSTCPTPPNVNDIIEDFNHSVLLYSKTATSGTMKGVKFDLYRQPDGSLFMAAKGNGIMTIITGDMTVDQANEIANSFVLDR